MRHPLVMGNWKLNGSFAFRATGNVHRYGEA